MLGRELLPSDAAVAFGVVIVTMRCWIQPNWAQSLLLRRTWCIRAAFGEEPLWKTAIPVFLSMSCRRLVLVSNVNPIRLRVRQYIGRKVVSVRVSSQCASRQVLLNTAVCAARDKGPASTVDGFPIAISNTEPIQPTLSPLDCE